MKTILRFALCWRAVVCLGLFFAISIGFPASVLAGWFSGESAQPGWYPGDGNVRFVDLTGKMYQGADADLVGIRFVQMGIHCAGMPSYIGGAAVVSWQDESGKFPVVPKGYGYLGGVPLVRIKSYTVQFRVKDRKDQVVHEESFDFIQKERGNHKGKVYHDRASLEDGCARDLVAFSKDLNLAYTTIEFWIKKIEWHTHPEG